MIETADIANFRCFEKVRLEGLTRINVVTGSNGSGKSALLEALYLRAQANAAAIQTIANARAVQMPFMISGGGLAFPVPIQGQTIGTYFDHLFRTTKKNEMVETASKISISYTDNNNVFYSLGIAYRVGGNEPVAVVRAPGGTTTSGTVVFDRLKRSKVEERAPIPITLNQFGQLQQPPATQFGPATFIFGADMNYAEVDNVTWFYQLKERGGAEQIVSFIINEFPFIEGIEVLAPAGINGLYAIMADGTRRRVSTVSSGIYKIISILLAAAHTHNGIIVIDEIENGIFYEKYPAVWRILYKFAKDTGNQIFVSSHSAECLGKLPDVIGQNTDDFCQLRTMRDNGSCTVSHINGVAMKAALSGENEVRGVTVGIHDNS